MCCLRMVLVCLLLSTTVLEGSGFPIAAGPCLCKEGENTDCCPSAVRQDTSSEPPPPTPQPLIPTWAIIVLLVELGVIILSICCVCCAVAATSNNTNNFILPSTGRGLNSRSPLIPDREEDDTANDIEQLQRRLLLVQLLEAMGRCGAEPEGQESSEQGGVRITNLD